MKRHCCFLSVILVFIPFLFIQHALASEWIVPDANSYFGEPFEQDSQVGFVTYIYENISLSEYNKYIDELKALGWIETASDELGPTYSNNGVDLMLMPLIEKGFDGKGYIAIIYQDDVDYVSSGLINIQTPKVADSSKYNIEEKIRSALLNNTSFLFKISDDHDFNPGATGNISMKSDSGTSNADQSTEWTETHLRNWSANTIIRIDNGVVSMEESEFYNCTLQMLDNDAGISIKIKTNDDVKASYMEISGIINGDSLTASQSVATATYSHAADLGLGNSFSGEYTVSLIELSQNQWPPKPVKLNYSRKTQPNNNWAGGDDIASVTLTWENENPPGVVKYYEIYRKKGVYESDKFELIATVSSGNNSWIDEFPGTTWDMFAYYVVAYTETGVPSDESNYCIF